MAKNFHPNTAFKREFYSPAGMVARHLRKRAKETEILAKAKVGKSKDKPPVLVHTIQADHFPVPTGNKRLTIEVHSGGEAAPYALAHHEGYQPFSVDNTLMVFPAGGGIVVTDEIDHPGYRGNPYLRRALETVMKADKAGVDAIRYH